ncbi:MAG: hypothetical protein IPM27_12245 [Nitrosomonadales bacterium]|nr:hypothetical protein [Nitrosomonadales bacterium]
MSGNGWQSPSVLYARPVDGGAPFRGGSWPRIEAVAAVYFISTSIINLVFAGDMIVTWFNITHIGAIAAGFYLIAFCARRFWLERQGRALGMAIAIACCLVIGIHDWLAIVTGSQLGTLLVMQFGPLLVLLLLGLWMTLQFSKVLDSEERRRQLIEQQIGEVSLELSAEHAKRMELERKNIILAERQNFSRELHDGMGGHLMALKSMLSNDGRKDEGILKALDQAIVDMRLLVDAIGEDNNDVGMIIGMVRSRIEPQVAHTPLKIKWKLGELPMECRLKTGFGLHLARIMREAITNVVRHAAANTLIVSAFCRDEGKRACIEIRDNGCGMPEAPRAGRGLSNIRTRAAELGGMSKSRVRQAKARRFLCVCRWNTVNSACLCEVICSGKRPDVCRSMHFGLAYSCDALKSVLPIMSVVQIHT